MALFEADFGATAVDVALSRLAHEGGVPDVVLQHARNLVDGVQEHRVELDARIAELAPQIPVHELGRVERAILRSAIYEVLYSAATSGPEAIRDAVVLARIYAGDAARRLVNGVLGHASRSSANRRT